MLRVIGLMSGTSLDGVDAAWLETDGEALGVFGPSLTLPYEPALRADLRRILDRAPSLRADDPDLLDATRRLTEAHIEAVRRIGRTADLIGFHGQTILHDPPRRRTWQIGDAQALAEAVGVPVAYGFREADVAAGGEGAPLVPLFHAALARALPKSPSSAATAPSPPAIPGLGMRCSTIGSGSIRARHSTRAARLHGPAWCRRR
jgi:anhydro-N-acetylmuramic acid kinase